MRPAPVGGSADVPPIWICIVPKLTAIFVACFLPETVNIRIKPLQNGKKFIRKITIILETITVNFNMCYSQFFRIV